MRRADVGEGSAAGERRARRRKPCCALARPPPVAAGGSTTPVLITIGWHPGLRRELVDRRQVLLDHRDGSDHDAPLMASALVTRPSAIPMPSSSCRSTFTRALLRVDIRD